MKSMQNFVPNNKLYDAMQHDYVRATELWLNAWNQCKVSFPTISFMMRWIMIMCAQPSYDWMHEINAKFRFQQSALWCDAAWLRARNRVMIECMKSMQNFVPNNQLYDAIHLQQPTWICVCVSWPQNNKLIQTNKDSPIRITQQFTKMYHTWSI